MPKPELSNLRGRRVIAVAEAPTQYHVDIYRRLQRELGPSFLALYGSKGQVEGQRYAVWGDSVIKNETGLMEGYHNSVIQNPVRSFLRTLDVRPGDSVLLHTILPRFTRSAAVCLKARGCRILFRGSAYQSPYRPFWRNSLGDLRDRAAFRLVDIFCATGTTAWRYYTRRAPGKPVVFSPYCTDEYVLLKIMQKYQDHRRVVRQSLGVSDQEKLVGYVGSFSQVKNTERLLDAMRQLDGHGYRLVLAGDGPLRHRLLQRIEEYGWQQKPVWRGLLQREEVGALLCATDVLALVSTYDAWGVVVNEALQLSNACVVSRAVGSAPDLVWEGENGAFVDPLDVESIAAGIRRAGAIAGSPQMLRTNDRLSRIFSSAQATRGILRAVNGPIVDVEAGPPGLEREQAHEF